MLIVTGLALGAAGSASAVVVHPFVGSFGSFANPQPVTVDPATGDVYAIDDGAATVQRFTSTGSPDDFSASQSYISGNSLTGTLGGGFQFDTGGSATEIAIAPPGAPGGTAGDIYVTESAANGFQGVIDVFDSSGTYLGQLTQANGAPFGESCGVATDPAGNVYVGEFGGNVDRFVPTSNPPTDADYQAQITGLGGICNVAADSTGAIYASTWPFGPLTKYDAAQFGSASPPGTQTDASSSAVSVDPVANDVYVDHGDQVAQYDSAGTLLGTSGSGHLSGNSLGVGISGTNGDLYASDASAGTVQHFGPGVDVTAPVVTIDPPSSITSTHATFTGTVNPEGTDPLNDAAWHFEYSTDGGATWTSTAGGDAGTGTSPVPVSDQVDTFIPDDAVQVRLVATNAATSATSSVQSFTTTAVAPDARTQPAQEREDRHAVLEATLAPHHADTTYRFEYGTTTAYGHTAPTPDADAGTANVTIGVVQPLYNLQPGTTYHYRIVATNQAGTAIGQDRTFTTTVPPPPSIPRRGIPGTGFLPDERGWEQVSPTSKNGADIMAEAARTRAAATEAPGLPMAATFTSLGAFADIQGTGVASEYMGIRTAQPGTQGWVTHAITPRQRSNSFAGAVSALDPLWEGDLSSDLTRGVFRALSPLTDVPDVANAENLYRRADLRIAGTGSYQLLTGCPACSSPLPFLSPFYLQKPWLAGASSDFRHVIFESIYPLAPGATADPNSGIPNLYESVDGAVRLAGILPGGAVAPRSVAGQGASNVAYTPHTISADGSRIIFTDTSTGDGRSTGTLYMRVTGTTTVQLNASDKTVPDAPQPATFWDASADGSRVFFTTSEALTDDDVNGAVDLYMYDVNAPAGHHLTRISVSTEPTDTLNGVDGVIGASDDGRYVYFIAFGQLVAGQPEQLSGPGIYEWHDGTISYIGEFIHPGHDELSDLPLKWDLFADQARVTSDGRHMLFVSTSGVGLTGYDHSSSCQGGAGGCAELYVYSADTHQLQCASCNPTGAPATADATDMADAGTGGADRTWHLSNALSHDGSRVFFSSSEALVPQAANGKSNAYEYDVQSGTVHLLSGGSDSSDSYFLDASASGNDAFVLTRQQLTGWDNDQNYDLYDARVGGGFPEPPASPPGCGGSESCHGPASVTAPGPVPGSATLIGAGDVKPPKAKAKPVRCRRGFARKRVKGRVRCVKMSRHKRAVKQAKHVRAHRRAR